MSVCGYTYILKMKVFNLAAHPGNVSNIGFGFLGDSVQDSIVFFTLIDFSFCSNKSLITKFNSFPNYYSMPGVTS